MNGEVGKGAKRRGVYLTIHVALCCYLNYGGGAMRVE